MISKTLKNSLDSLNSTIREYEKRIHSITQSSFMIECSSEIPDGDNRRVIAYLVFNGKTIDLSYEDGTTILLRESAIHKRFPASESLPLLLQEAYRMDDELPVKIDELNAQLTEFLNSR